ncbi:V-set domain-containing T-cell activation inhibitor 1-like [Symphorus nematophorus]
MAASTAALSVLFFLSVWIFSVAAPRQQRDGGREFFDVTAKPGEDVPLQCRTPTDASIIVIKWNKSDLKSDDYVFFYRENRPYEHLQVPSFRGRVELRDPEMKDGDASVILKNVNVKDGGTYDCLISARIRETVTNIRCSISVMVTHLDHTAERTEDRGSREGGDVTTPVRHKVKMTHHGQRTD